MKHEILNFLEAIRPHINVDPVESILECGSCDLVHATAFTEIYPTAKVYTFECCPANIITCREKLKVNPIKNLFFFETALMDYEGAVQFYPVDMNYSPSKNSGAGSIYIFNPDHWVFEPVLQERKPIQVPCTTIQNWAKINKIEKIDLLWLDAQGSEYLIMKGMGDMLSNVKALQVETCLRNLYINQPLIDKTMGILNNFGFEFIKHNGISNGGWFTELIYVNRKFCK